MINYNRTTVGTKGEVVLVNTTAYHHNNVALGFNVRSNTFQERMILCMRKLGLNQRQLWKQLNEFKDTYGYVYDPRADEHGNSNVSFSYPLINEYYHGICVPKSSRLRFMAKFFGVSEYWLEGSGNLDAELYGRQTPDMPRVNYNAARGRITIAA